MDGRLTSRKQGIMMILDQGNSLLDRVVSNVPIIQKYVRLLKDYKIDNRLEDDAYAWLATVLALKAVDSGNLGIGAILLNAQNQVVAMGHNEVFQPFFRSDAHAEMIVMTQFEKQNKNMTGMQGYCLYTSLEPCPMCLTRLITSGVGKVLHVTPDMKAGMVHLKDRLPEVWQSFLKNQTFEQADCSKELVAMAENIFKINQATLDGQIKARRHGGH
jgi:tRNA(Arg) A34 adenosine deaminase TadA